MVLMRLVDMHQDLAFSSMRMDVFQKAEQSNISMLRDLESCVIFGSIFPHIPLVTGQQGDASMVTTPSRDMLLNQILFYRKMCRDESLGHVTFRANLENPGINILFALEGTDSLIANSDIDMLHTLGVRSCGLTWNYDTKFASSCHSKKDYGLTGSGEKLVDDCNRLGIAVDLAHSSKKTILDTCSISSRPVLFSHGNVSSLDAHVRNIDDQSIDAICSTGGLIGITAIPQTLGREPSIERMVKHATYVGENFGWEHVAIGSDFLGIESTPKGFENVGKLSQLREMLGPHAEAVLYENALRALRQILQ